METLDFFWSFRSHYCYLALDRVQAIPSDFNVRINVRPVYPIAIRMPEFFANIPADNPNRWRYIVHDAGRIAERLNIPFQWPDPDPVDMEMTTLKIAREQPHIHRLTRLGVAACRRGKGLEFTATVARLIFGGTRNWDQGKHLAEAADNAGLQLSEMDAEITANPGDYDAEIESNERALNDAGHWGVPTLVLRGEPFFGQDRIEDCRWRLNQLTLGSTQS